MRIVAHRSSPAHTSVCLSFSKFFFLPSSYKFLPFSVRVRLGIELRVRDRSRDGG